MTDEQLKHVVGVRTTWRDDIWDARDLLLEHGFVVFPPPGWTVMLPSELDASRCGAQAKQ